MAIPEKRRALQIRYLRFYSFLLNMNEAEVSV